MYTLYLSTIPNIVYIFADGSRGEFTGGRFATDDPKKIKQLDAEVAAKHPHIYQDQEKLSVSLEELAPDFEYRQRVIAEFLATQKEIASGTKDCGSTDAKFVPADSKQFQELATGSAKTATQPVKVNLKS